MYVSIQELPTDARLWIYQADRKLSASEEEKINALTSKFLETWTAHEKNLKASFEIRYHLFLFILIDEKAAMASGCSIDKSMHFILQLERELGLSFTNRNLFAYRKGQEVELISRKEFEEAIAAGTIDDTTIVFNNLIQNKKELDSEWEIPFAKSWHKTLMLA